MGGDGLRPNPILRAEHSEQRVDRVRGLGECRVERNAGDRPTLDELDALKEIAILLVELAGGGVHDIGVARGVCCDEGHAVELLRQRVG